MTPFLHSGRGGRRRQESCCEMMSAGQGTATALINSQLLGLSGQDQANQTYSTDGGQGDFQASGFTGELLTIDCQ